MHQMFSFLKKGKVLEVHQKFSNTHFHFNTGGISREREKFAHLFVAKDNQMLGLVPKFSRTFASLTEVASAFHSNFLTDCLSF